MIVKTRIATAVIITTIDLIFHNVLHAFGRAFLFAFQRFRGVENKSQYDDCKQYNPQYAVDGIKRIDYVVKTEKAQRISNQKTEKYDERFVLFIAQNGQFIRVRKEQGRAIAHDFEGGYKRREDCSRNQNAACKFQMQYFRNCQSGH